MAFNARDHIDSTPLEDIPDPPTLKDCHCYGQITSYERGQTPWNPDTECILFTVQLTRPGEDVDEKDIEGLNLRELSLRPIAYEWIPTRYRDVRELLLSMKLNPKLSIDANLPDTVGREVLCHITAKPSNRPGDTRVFNNIASMKGTGE